MKHPAEGLALWCRRHDVVNLTGILCNSSLGTDLRRSAAEQLLSMTSESRLQHLLADPTLLNVLVDELQPQAGSSAGSSTLGRHSRDTQLLTACLNLAAALALHCAEAREWLRVRQQGCACESASAPVKVFSSLDYSPRMQT